MNKVKLSKTLSYILRHNPQDFGLQLNPDGSVKVEELISALQEQRFPGVNYKDVKKIVENDEKGRFSLLKEGEKIRANYGHSIEGVHPDYKLIKPPEILYHGTPRHFKESILKEGLKPMNRNFVHLSSTEEEAKKVGSRRDSSPVILKVKAEELFKTGQEFYCTGRGIYLTNYIPPDYID